MQNTFSSTEMHLFVGWHVIYTKPRHEKRVFEELTCQKFTSYLPVIKHTSQWCDRQKIIDKPLFPSYIFVNLQNAIEYHRALQINGAVSFIRFNDKPAIVKESEIETIKKMIENCSKIELAQQNIRVGEKCQIQSGPLAGFKCEVISMTGKNKILVRIDSLRQNITAELDGSCMLKVIS